MADKSIDLNNLTLRHYPDPFLRQVAAPVERITAEVVKLAERMVEIMLESRGIGLAAPQVGVGKRIITVCPTGDIEDVRTIINPVASEFSGWSEIEEGCLSVPEVRANVRRPACCTVRGVDIAGKEVLIAAEDLMATVLQHELDHLDGKLFIDRLGGISRIAVRHSLKDLERQYANSEVR